MAGPSLVRVSCYLRRKRSAPHPCELFSRHYCRSVRTGSFEPPHRFPYFCSNPRDHLTAITYHAIAQNLDRDSQHWVQTCSAHVHTVRVCGGLLCNQLSRCGQPQNCPEVGLGGGLCWWLHCTITVVHSNPPSDIHAGKLTLQFMGVDGYGYGYGYFSPSATSRTSCRLGTYWPGSDIATVPFQVSTSRDALKAAMGTDYRLFGIR